MNLLNVLKMKRKFLSLPALVFCFGFTSSSTFAAVVVKCDDLVLADSGDAESFTPQSPLKEINDPKLKELMDHLNSIASQLYMTSGFKDNAEVLSAAQKTSGPIGELYRSAVKILELEQIEIATQLPTSIRSKIVKNGFLNMHQVGTSQGTVIDRDEAESSTANFTESEWSQIPAELKPKFAAAFPAKNLNLAGPESQSEYAGNDRYFFSLQKVKERLTVTPGDSFNRFKYWQGSSPFKPTSWDQIYLPWQDRYLIIPFIAQGLAQQRLGFPPISTSPDIHPLEYGAQPAAVGEGALAKWQAKWNIANMDYIELQIWGRLTLDDVSAFEYLKTPPSGPFLKELLRRGIEIRDGTSKFNGKRKKMPADQWQSHRI